MVKTYLRSKRIVVERDAQAERVKRDAEFYDDEDVERVLEVRLQLSHDEEVE